MPAARILGAAFAPSVAAIASVVLSAPPASATITHQIVVEFAGAVPPPDRDSAILSGATSADITTAISAGILGSGYDASGSVGPFGALGVTGFHFAPGDLDVQVAIEDDNITNPFSLPMHAVANFIIDGGNFNLTAGSNDPSDPASLTWQLDVYSDALGGLFSPSHFQSFLILESTDFISLQITQGGADTGAFQTTPTAVEMPFSFQSIDLGVIPGGGSIDLHYVLSIRTHAQIAEGIFFEFSDPLDVSGIAPFSVTFSPVPEPTSLLLLCVACAMSVVFRGRPSTRAAGPLAPNRD